jgi:hypothetical protein
VRLDLRGHGKSGLTAIRTLYVTGCVIEVNGGLLMP